MLFFFMWAVLGIYLFGAINIEQGSEDGLHRRANFNNFGLSMLTLLRVATGDDWTQIMFDSMVQPPLCTTGDNPTRDFGCGTVGAYAFFLSFSVVRAHRRCWPSGSPHQSRARAVS